MEPAIVLNRTTMYLIRIIFKGIHGLMEVLLVLMVYMK